MIGLHMANLLKGKWRAHLWSVNTYLPFFWGKNVEQALVVRKDEFILQWHSPMPFMEDVLDSAQDPS